MFKIFKKKTKHPLTIVVQNGQWRAYGEPDLTSRNILLAELLHGMGGINESVPNGYYHFNAELRGTNWIMTLDPVKK